MILLYGHARAVIWMCARFNVMKVGDASSSYMQNRKCCYIKMIKFIHVIIYIERKWNVQHKWTARLSISCLRKRIKNKPRKRRKQTICSIIICSHIFDSHNIQFPLFSISKSFLCALIYHFIIFKLSAFCSSMLFFYI